jgi:hypothetical protein
MILSAPVLDAQGNFLGIVDTLDIIFYIIGIFPKEDKFEAFKSGRKKHSKMNTYSIPY